MTDLVKINYDIDRIFIKEPNTPERKGVIVLTKVEAKEMIIELITKLLEMEK